MDWTDERVASLTKMWLEGQSASQVARQLGGVTRNGVIGKVHRLGLSGRATPSAPRSTGKAPRQPTVHVTGPARPVADKVVKMRGDGLPRAPKINPKAPTLPVVVNERPSATVLTLGKHGCRWPIGDPDAEGFGFCGVRRGNHVSYCDGHAGASKRREEPKKRRTAVPAYRAENPHRFASL